MKWLVRDATFFDSYDEYCACTGYPNVRNFPQQLFSLIYPPGIDHSPLTYDDLWLPHEAYASHLFCCSFLLFRLMIYAKSHFFKLKEIFLFFSKLASRRNPPNPAIWLVPKAGGFSRSCRLTRSESLAASFTSLFVVCEWAKPVIFKPFLF